MSKQYGWVMLKSSNIRACWYFRATKMLLIRFVSGAAWIYHPVPWSTYLGFRRAKSHGEYFSAHIRDSKEIHSQLMEPQSGDMNFTDNPSRKVNS